MKILRSFRRLFFAVLLAATLSSNRAAAPTWWAERGVLTSGATANDYAAANLGQVKQIATKAYAEMEAKLPGGAGTALTTLINSWSAAPASGVVRNDYAAVNQGQLKALAKLFYDRLAQVGYTGQPLTAGQTYPWTTTTADDNDYAAVNIGQVKFVFSFDPSLLAVNVPPVVSLTSPAAGASFTIPATITLAANASDSDGTVTKVEFYQGTTKLGEATAQPYSYLWSGMSPGSYSVTARAYDNASAATTSSAIALTVLANPLSAIGFESSSGYAPGPLAGQGNWVVTGNASISTSQAHNGTQSLKVPAGSAVSVVSQDFPQYSGSPVVFIDYFARLATGSGPETAGWIHGAGGRVALVQMTDGRGELFVFNGDGAGGGVWQPTGFKVDVDSNCEIIGWLHLTFREDYVARRWDLYAGGHLIAANKGFLNNTGTVSPRVMVTGSPYLDSYLDDLALSFDNPLFTDADHDGIDDAWELAHGLNPAVDDRLADPDGDGRTNVQEYLDGTDPHDFFNGQGPSLTSLLPVIGRVDSTGLLKIKVKDAATGIPLANAPVDFSVTGGGATLAGSSNATASVRADSKGVATVGITFSGFDKVTVNVAAGGTISPASLAVEVGPIEDTDANGLGDKWEMDHFGHIGVDPAADPDGDGFTNLQEYRNGSDPLDILDGQTLVVKSLLTPAGEVLPDGHFRVWVGRSDGVPLRNIEVAIQILDTSNTLSEDLSASGQITVQTNAKGIAEVYITPNSGGGGPGTDRVLPGKKVERAVK